MHDVLVCGGILASVTVLFDCELLEEQLGLKLKPGQGPVDAIVIDSIKSPSEN